MLLLLSSKIGGRSETAIAVVYNSSPVNKTELATTLKHAFPHPTLPRLLYSLTATDSTDALNFGADAISQGR